jgi:hypothetical protein
MHTKVRLLFAEATSAGATSRLWPQGRSAIYFFYLKLDRPP